MFSFCNGDAQQELEEQRRREASERQELDRWKDEERRKVYQEMAELKQLLTQELRNMASKNSSVEAVSTVTESIWTFLYHIPNSTKRN